MFGGQAPDSLRGSRKCRLRVRDALCCQPCGQSPRPLSITAGGRAPSATACCGQRCSGGVAPGHTGTSKWRDLCSVNGKLRASPQRQAIGDHLDAALIMPSCLEVQVAHQDMCGDSGTLLTADPGNCTFERPTPCPENTRPRAGSDVVTQSLKRTPTAASRRGKWQREPQATEKQDPEERRVEGELWGNRANSEQPGGEGAGL